MPETVAKSSLKDELRKSTLAGDLVDAIRIRREGAGAQRGFHDAGPISVIIEGNARVPGGAGRARAELVQLFLERLDPAAVGALGDDATWWRMAATDPSGDDGTVLGDIAFAPGDTLDLRNSRWTDQYLFGVLAEDTIATLASARVRITGTDGTPSELPLIYKIWLNHAVGRFVYESGRTVKCDAARAAFAAAGDGVVWAVADTGVDGRHPHFRTHRTLDLPDGIRHMDFTDPAGSPLLDENGHGSHVAGIIAGETRRRPDSPDEAQKSWPLRVVVRRKVRELDAEPTEVEEEQARISGVAPRCKIVSLKVLRKSDGGDVATLLAALGYIQQVNNNGRNLRIHGVNLSLGYTFDARWFAAGQSPLCVEVDRLVKSGVVVVVAAGNSGYGTVQALDRTVERASHFATISDPGNADLAITVGSTHRDSPHSYGVSYFSAKGPTADGRMKPDLVAPGERIVSVRRGEPDEQVSDAVREVARFGEDTGTSMAAPHVSGAIAAFLSVRREFQGRPEAVKRVFVESATDLKRRPEFQGAGLIDAMRALQSV